MKCLRVTEGNRLRSAIENFFGAHHAVDDERVLGRIDGRYAAMMAFEVQARGVRLPTILSSGVKLHDVYSFAVGKRVRTSVSNCEREP